VLKRYEDALRDGDHIYALIKGSACNNDGVDRVGFTAPGIEGQTAVIQSALRMAEVDPETIGYIEAHGTGTSLGDPIEIEALTRAFHTSKKNYCGIGSVKTNVGHLNTAAGVTGFIKTVLALKYKLIPPSLHFTRANPKIDFENSPFYVNTGLRKWKNEEYPSRAGVSSFGIGGTNAHVVLEEFLEGASDKEGTGGLAPMLFLLSAKTETALDKMTINLAEYLKKNPYVDLADVAYTLQVGRKAFNYRRILVCSNVQEAVDILSDHEPGKIKTFNAEEEKQSVIFMFPGQGSQYVNMGWGLYQTEPVFRQEMDRCFEILKPMMGYDPKEILYPSAGFHGDHRSNRSNKSYIPPINQTENAQPLLFAFEYALAKLLIQWGFEPHAMMGHSIGEYTAACLSGVISLEDALMVVALRGQLMQKMPAGDMLSVPISEEKLKPLLDANADEDISLAAVNAPDNCVVSGTPQAVAAFEKQLKKQGYECRPLHTSHAYHSNMMEPILDTFEKQFQRIRIKLNAPGIPYISNLTGGWITHNETRNPGYWAKHLRQPVRFSDGLIELFALENALFVEVGPGSSLSAFAKKHPHKKTGQKVIHLTRHPKEKAGDIPFLLSKIGECWLYGREIDWSGFYKEEQRQRMPLPSYPFERQWFWPREDVWNNEGLDLSQRTILNKKKDLAHWFYIPTWKRSILTKRQEPLKPAVWLFFLDECGIGAGIMKELADADQEVIAVRTGPGFSQVADGSYVMNPGKSNDYDALVRELAVSQKIPEMIVHLWGVTGVDEIQPGAVSLKKTQDYGFYSLLYLVKALGKRDFNNDMQLTVVSNHIQDITGEEIICLTSPSPGTFAAFRKHHCWIRSFERVKLEENSSRNNFRKKGVYLVTGGLGGIGIILAQHLAEHFSPRLILTGRSAFPAPGEWQEWLNSHDPEDKVSVKIRKVQELQILGAEVLVFKADVSDEQQMKELVALAERQLGPINGVIHAAGNLKEKAFVPINNLTKEICEKHFQAKIRGTEVLEKVFQGRELDFCLMMSSLSSILGGLGHAAYSAANIFMDKFVHYYNRTGYPYWMSVNWDTWQTTGQSDTALTAEEGVEAFERILSRMEGGQLAVSATDLQERIKRWITLETIRKKEDINKNENRLLRARPNLSTAFIPPETQLEHLIVDIWQELLGLKQIGIHDNFFDLGATSLDMIQVARKLTQKLGKNIPVDTLFEYPTVPSVGQSLIGSNDKEHEEISNKKLNKTTNRMKGTFQKFKAVKNGRN
jgi:malonyl CoA-acyl carrier protein transacylase/NAD(P)-dependent dehydrogenase (short-subunit alcohol dehydrogenase family)/acyl carrier protein